MFQYQVLNMIFLFTLSWLGVDLKENIKMKRLKTVYSVRIPIFKEQVFR